MSYEDAKTAIEAATTLSRGALHIYAAVAVQLAAALVTRRSFAHPLPWLCALVATVGDEWFEQSVDRMELADILSSMILPTVLLLVTRFAPFVVLPKRGRR